MLVIEAVSSLRILNSHAAFTTEFVVSTDRGIQGRGASPEGETISIYEDRTGRDPSAVVETLRASGLFGRPIGQEELDGHLTHLMDVFGRNTCYALSLAFHEAEASSTAPKALVPQQVRAPRLCLNILNGGRHAYTNPVLSDFPEYLLVAHSDDIAETMTCHDAIQTVIREDLLRKDRVVVDGNPVARFATLDNRECLEFLIKILDRLGLAEGFDLMIDASGGDLWTGTSYELALTDGGSRSGEAFVAYWLDLLRQYPVRFLEDPFREEDRESWRVLKEAQDEALLIGDNLYSSDAARIEKGSAEGLTDGVIVKPNQAGTVSAVRRTFQTARRCGQVVIASHRSISTESTLEATLACESRADYIKIGPLLTDYSSVLRLNDIIRLTT